MEVKLVNGMIFTNLRPTQETPLSQQSYAEDCLPSIEDVGIFLAEARELRESLEHLAKTYPRFNMSKSINSVQMLVYDLEDLICDLED